MTRITNPIIIPENVDIALEERSILVQGRKGSLRLDFHKNIKVSKNKDLVLFTKIDNTKQNRALIGTTRALIKNMMIGVTKGFEKKLVLHGIGYRAFLKEKILNLSLGFSHPINYRLPDGIQMECLSQTELAIHGIDKQIVGQVAAEIRSFHPPDVYKGKGVRYFEEIIYQKEAKKK